MRASVLDGMSDPEFIRQPAARRFAPRAWGAGFTLDRRHVAVGVLFFAVFVVFDASHWLILTRALHARPMDATVVGLSALEAVSWLACTPFIFWLVGRVQAATARVAARVALVLLAGLALALAISYLGTRLRFAAIPLPLINDRREAETFAAWLGFLRAGCVYLGIVAVATARDYVRRHHADRERAARVEAQLASAQLEGLRRQLDPHFLFNTLNLISALAEDDPRGVRRMISRLGELLRFSLEGGQEPEISVTEELALLDRYLDIMRMRFEGRLAIDVDVDDRTRAALVPSLILQPLVENAIRHGVEKSRGPGWIAISSVLEQDTIVLRVRDSGPGRVPRGDGPTAPAARRSHGAGLGLRNTVARLEQLYGAAGRFTLESDTPDADGRAGMVAEVRVPYHSRSELRAVGVAGSGRASSGATRATGGQYATR